MAPDQRQSFPIGQEHVFKAERWRMDEAPSESE